MKLDAKHFEQERELDLMYVLATILRGWGRMALLMVCLGALLGGYTYVKTTRVRVDAGRVNAAQAAIDASKNAIAANETEMQNNAATIAADKERIAANEEALETYRASLEMRKASLAGLQAGLDRAQGVLANPKASPEAMATIIVQLSALTENIAAADGQVKAAADQVKTAENEIITWKREMVTLANRTEDLLDANDKLRIQIPKQEAELAEAQQGVRGKANGVGKRAVMGALLGAFLYCAAVLARCLLNGRLKIAEELHRRYGVPVLGELYSKRAKRHDKLSECVNKMAGDTQTLPEGEKVYELAAAGIQLRVEKPAKIAVTGTVDEEALQDAAEKLRGYLPEGYEVTAQANPVYNARFLPEMKEYAVVLVEMKGISREWEINRLMELLAQDEVDVIGALVR